MKRINNYEITAIKPHKNSQHEYLTNHHLWMKTLIEFILPVKHRDSICKLEGLLAEILHFPWYVPFEMPQISRINFDPSAVREVLLWAGTNTWD